MFWADPNTRKIRKAVRCITMIIAQQPFEFVCSANSDFEAIEKLKLFYIYVLHLQNFGNE